MAGALITATVLTVKTFSPVDNPSQSRLTFSIAMVSNRLRAAPTEGYEKIAFLISVGLPARGSSSSGSLGTDRGGGSDVALGSHGGGSDDVPSLIFTGRKDDLIITGLSRNPNCRIASARFTIHGSGRRLKPPPCLFAPLPQFSSRSNSPIKESSFKTSYSIVLISKFGTFRCQF